MPAMCLNCANSSPVTKSGSNISVPSDKKAAETELVAIQTERDGLSARTAALEGEVKRLRRELEDEKEKTTQLKEAEVQIKYQVGRLIIAEMKSVCMMCAGS